MPQRGEQVFPFPLPVKLREVTRSLSRDPTDQAHSDNSAFGDSRFEPVSAKELKRLQCGSVQSSLSRSVKLRS